MSYLLIFKSYYIDKCLSKNSFDDSQITIIIKDGRRQFPSKKQNCLPITKNIFKKIMKDDLLFILNVNVDIIFKVAWTDFMRMKKLIYTMVEAKKALFIKTSLMKFDFSFAEGD